MSMNKLIMSTLKPLNHPVYPLHYPGESDTYITFFQYNESASLNADDEEKITGFYYQVDVWTKNPSVYESLSKQVKDSLEANGFVRRSANDLYEKETPVYHKAMRFYYAKNQ
ncbi:hypothetical protein BBP13_12035 [Limosilactobacillus reuteri]|uniref:tail completion protein gp17 n=1 Tax=Limosilactobacillus reuteri TaxID=1598 RepID=UPI00081C0586|nr:hypothetical protein [Limosilactobacillus reuteri]OCW71255.1 hypothetical protein BBP13_12035 [Limosilactobacillus reuteri]